MDAIKIKVADYYGNPSYYSVMPNEIFDALELASLKGETGNGCGQSIVHANG